MKTTIVYDNETHRAGLIADWGFACVADTEEAGILFAAGASDAILLHIMSKLGVAPASVDENFTLKYLSRTAWEQLSNGKSPIKNDVIHGKDMK